MKDTTRALIEVHKAAIRIEVAIAYIAGFRKAWRHTKDGRIWEDEEGYAAKQAQDYAKRTYPP